jgi:hypothetical protein
MCPSNTTESPEGLNTPPVEPRIPAYEPDVEVVLESRITAFATLPEATLIISDRDALRSVRNEELLFTLYVDGVIEGVAPVLMLDAYVVIQVVFNPLSSLSFS